MEKCAKFIVDDSGNIQQLISEISCNGETVKETVEVYPNFIVWGLIAVGVFLVWTLFLYPFWKVWASRKSGLAELAEAENAEKVAIAEANARIGAAEANKKAEIIEAEAIAESIKTIGTSLEQNPSYNRFQWIKMMERSRNATIYVPTESNLPILESMRLMKKSSE